ncbi:hypothetical protein EGI92_21585, partial [Stutzerimonas stutzeri]
APTLADRAILPTAWRGRYFFNRIGRWLPSTVFLTYTLTGCQESVIFRRQLHQSARFEACCVYGS